MKKIYEAPQTEVTKISNVTMICTSESKNIISSETIDGANALSKDRVVDFSQDDADFNF